MIPLNSDAAVPSNVLWRGIAWARGKRRGGDEGGPRGSVGEGERRASGRPRGEGFGRALRWGRPARLLVGCGSALLGQLAWASAGPIGLARAWAFSPFF